MLGGLFAGGLGAVVGTLGGAALRGRLARAFGNDLPAALRSNPTYRKFNPADFPILILAMTSKTLSPGQIYDQASNIIQQKLSQISGVGDVSLSSEAWRRGRPPLCGGSCRPS